MKFEIKFLPARYGDCIWIEYGDDTKIYRILIDGGTAGTKADIKKLLTTLPEEERFFELMVVTHIDRDHIEGILSLLEEDTLSFGVKDFWFNGWGHLQDTESFGALQGERLSAAIVKHQLNWNGAFNGKAVVIPSTGVLPVIDLEGGMKLTLLSPEKQNLVKLRDKWEKEVKHAGLIPGFGLEPPPVLPPGVEGFGALPDVEALNNEEFHEDEAEANGSSIAFLAEFGGRTVFFAGDSFPGVVLDSLNKLHDGKVPLDLVKLSHHASAHNTSPELIGKFDCNKYVISTNGSIFHHPAAVTMARVIKRANENSELLFNYRSLDNEIWDSLSLKLQHNYTTVYPADKGISIDLI
jgi:beta-lactamase superfamily II metal-dependent hydrolase